MMREKPLLGRLLIEAGALSDADLERALQVAEVERTRLGAALVSMRLCSKTQIACALAQQMDVPFTDLRETPPEVQALKLVPAALARQLKAVPVRFEPRTGNEARLLVVAINPFDFGVDDVLQRTTGKSILVTSGVEAQIEQALLQYHQLVALYPHTLKLDDEAPHVSRTESIVRAGLEKPVSAPIGKPPASRQAEVGAALRANLPPAGVKILGLKAAQDLLAEQVSQGHKVILEFHSSTLTISVVKDGKPELLGAIAGTGRQVTLKAGIDPVLVELG